MSAEARAMLDALMGGDRNAPLPPGTALPGRKKSNGALVLPKKRTKSVYDGDVDPLYCAWGYDVYELFVNTKSAIGNNPKTVDAAARDEYLALPKHEQDRLGFEGILFRKLSDLVRQCDRTVARNKEKLQQELNKQKEKCNGRDYIEEIDEGALQELARLTVELEQMEAEVEQLTQDLEKQVLKQKDLEEQISHEKKLGGEVTTAKEAIKTDDNIAEPPIKDDESNTEPGDPVKTEDMVAKTGPLIKELEGESTQEATLLQQELHSTILTKQQLLFDLARKVQQYAPIKDAYAFCLKNLHYIKSDIASDKTVCEVSGNFMSARDADERIAAHFAGKQYVGWKLVRTKLKELQDKYGRFGPPNPSRVAPPPVQRVEERGRDSGRGTDGGRWERGVGYNDRGPPPPRHEDRGGGYNDRGGGYNDRGGGYSDRGGGYSDRGGGGRDGGRGRYDDRGGRWGR